MEVTIAHLTVPDLAAATRAGSSDSLLGSYLLGGSYCAVDRAQETEILNAARMAGRGLVVLDAASPADIAAAGAHGALCLIVTDGAGRDRPLAIFQGRGLPVLGSIPACTLRDLQHTWTALAGGTPMGGGRHLLHEQPQDWDPQLERQLTQRLRQLYGE